MDKRSAIVLPSVCALICSACLTSAKRPVTGNDDTEPESGIADPDSGDGGGGSSPSGPTTANGDDGGGLAARDGAPDAGDGRDGGSSALDATSPTADGAPEGKVEAGVDGASSESGAMSDADADGGAKMPLKGVAGSDCAELLSLNVAWWYDWELGPTGCTSTPFVPMIWGHANEQTAAGIASEVSAGLAAGYKYVLGFNEPDNASQSNIPVATAISLWPSFNNPSVIVGSPATQGNATGLAWIQDFMTQVNADTTGKLRVDFIATHWYGWDTGACDPAANTLESWIAGIEAIPGNRPIWLTEWGCLNDSNPNAATVQAFYAGALAMFAKHPRLVRYAWYQWETYNELVDADGGALTALGTAYADAPAFH